MVKKIVVLTCVLLLITLPAHALFQLENDDTRRPGRSGLGFGQVAGGTAINISWGIGEYTNLYFVTGPGAGLGLKQRLLQENVNMPLSLDLTAETTSLKNWHTSAYGCVVRKKIGDDVSGFLKFEAIDNNADWSGLEGLTQRSISSAGIDWKLWQDTALLLQISDRPDTFGTASLFILL